MIVESPTEVKFPMPKRVTYEHLIEQGLYLQTIDNMDDFMQNLVMLDVLQQNNNYNEIESGYKLSAYNNTIEDFYLKHRDPEEIIIVQDSPVSINFHRISREHFLHMSESEDYINYLQVIEKIPVALQPSYLLRHSKRNTSYLDNFLQKNPNLFYENS